MTTIKPFVQSRNSGSETRRTFSVPIIIAENALAQTDKSSQNWPPGKLASELSEPNSAEKVRPNQTARAASMEYVKLERGMKIRREISLNTKGFKVITPRIHLTFEYDKAVQDNLGTRGLLKDESDHTHLQRYWADIEWLPNQQNNENGERVSVDVEDLPVGSDIRVDFNKEEWPKGFQMRWREELFSIVYFVELSKEFGSPATTHP